MDRDENGRCTDASGRCAYGPGHLGEHSYEAQPRATLVYCKRCLKTHAVEPGEQECAPGAWVLEEPYAASA